MLNLIADIPILEFNFMKKVFLKISFEQKLEEILSTYNGEQKSFLIRFRLQLSKL